MNIRYNATIAIEVDGNLKVHDADTEVGKLNDKDLQQYIKDDIRKKISERLGSTLCDWVTVTIDSFGIWKQTGGKLISYEAHAIQHISGNRGD